MQLSREAHPESHLPSWPPAGASTVSPVSNTEPAPEKVLNKKLLTDLTDTKETQVPSFLNVRAFLF